LNLPALIVLVLGMTVQAALTAWLVWLLVLAGSSIRARRKPPGPVVERFRRLAVIIPAHNEEKLIGATIASIRESGYPLEFLDILVVADNCRDRTAAIAEAAGALTVVREDELLRGKGYALQAGIEAVKKLDPPFEALVLFDADTLVVPGYLQRLNTDLDRGRRVVQGRYSVAEPDRTWFTRLTHLGFVLRNYYQYPGLVPLGLAMPLRGSGICFGREVVERFGWKSTSLTEDLDFSITLIEAGYQPYFEFHAENRQYMPPDPASARVQRTRWSAGEAQAATGRLFGLIGRSVKRGEGRALLQYLFMAMPPLSLLLVLSVGLALLFSFFIVWGPAWTGWPFVIAAATTAGYGVYFLLGLTVTGLSAAYLQAVALIPVYALWRATVHLIVALPGRIRKMTWRNTERV